MPRIAYAFSPTDGTYQGPVAAQESPMEPGNFLRPQNALFRPVPAYGPREIPVFAPDFKAGAAAASRDATVTPASKWVVLPDWRGVPFYSTKDGNPCTMLKVGEIPESDFTEQARPSPLHIWTGEAWEIDSDLKAGSVKQERDGLLTLVSARIGALTDAVDFGMATQDEFNHLGRLKQYRIALSRIEQQAGYPTQVSWPSPPD